MDQRILNDAKFEIIDSTKKNVFTKKYIEKIKNAKSVDEINKIMDDYNKKKKVTKFTVVVSGAALLVIAKKLISSGSARKCEADLNNAYNEYEKALNDLESHIKEFINFTSIMQIRNFFTGFKFYCFKKCTFSDSIFNTEYFTKVSGFTFIFITC